MNYNRLIIIFFATILLASSTRSNAIQLIRFATVAPEGSAWMEIMRAIDEELRSGSGGEVGFKFYPNMSMGDEKDVLRKMRLGQINGAGFTGFGLGEIIPEIRILELPYLFDNTDELDTVTAQMTAYFSSELAAKGFKLLGWADVGWIYFFANKPVAEPSDLAGTKVWMWEGDPLARVFFNELQKTPISLSITDVHLSLQTGLIDAVYCSPLATLSLQWFTKVKYISDVPFTHAIGAVLIDTKTFDSLTPENRDLLLRISRSKLDELMKRLRKDNVESLQQLIKEGLQFVKSNDFQRVQLAAVGKRVQQALVGELYSQDLLDRLNRLIEEYRARHRQPLD